MYQFSRSDPAFQDYVDSQFAVINAVCGSLLGSIRSVCDTNVKLGQTMFERTLGVVPRMPPSAGADDVPGAVTGGAEPGPGPGVQSERRIQPERRASKASHGGQPAA